MDGRGDVGWRLMMEWMWDKSNGLGGRNHRHRVRGYWDRSMRELGMVDWVEAAAEASVEVEAISKKFLLANSSE